MSAGDGAPVAQRTPGALGVVVLSVVGLAAAWRLSLPAPAGSGAARLADPSVLLAVFDSLWVLAVAWPSARDLPHALQRALVVVFVGAPFHAALAAAAGAGSGHLGASALLLAGFGVAGCVWGARRGRLYAPCLAFAALGWPLVVYGLAEFTRLDVLALLRASPLTCPVLLGRGAPVAVAGEALPALVCAALLAAVAWLRVGRGEVA